MRNTIKRLFVLLLILCLLCLQLACGEAIEPVTIAEIQKYGNLVLSISGSDFLAAGYDYGDIITVSIAGAEYDMPIGTNYSDVDTGSMVCRVKIDEAAGEDFTILAVNMGSFAETAGIAFKKETGEEPGYAWEYAGGIELPVGISISMKEVRGYYDEWMLRQLVRSNSREDYAHLSDAEFANFRPVETTGMGEGKLFRSSSPVNPELGRSTYADAAMQEAGIATVINLADSEITYEGWENSYYHSCGITALGLDVNFEGEHFRSGFAKGMRAVISGNAPFLVHCNEGKDRAAFVSAVLECLMGAPAEEVIADYMVTYYNYYGIQPGTAQYDAIAESNIMKSLAAAFEIESITDPEINLAAEAEAYMLEKLKLTRNEIASLKAQLS